MTEGKHSSTIPAVVFESVFFGECLLNYHSKTMKETFLISSTTVCCRGACFCFILEYADETRHCLSRPKQCIPGGLCCVGECGRVMGDSAWLY